MLEDIVEAGTIGEAPELLAYVEARATQLRRPAFFERGKTVTLRICNSLLRRLSRARPLPCGVHRLSLRRHLPACPWGGTCL